MEQEQLQYLAEKIIELEEKLSDSNENSYTEFDKAVARKAFVDYYAPMLHAKREDFAAAKILAAKIEDEHGVLFPHSNWFEF